MATDLPHRTKAYSYLRFSTPEQRNGDSARRQRALAVAYARKHRLTLDETLSYLDAGVSGFRGENVTFGKLGEFLAAVQSGLVPRGSLLLVENLDRLSRDHALLAQNLLTQIILAGVSVVSLIDERLYSEAELRREPIGLIYALINFIRANEESEIKSRRAKATWAEKRRHAGKRILTARVPGWLRAEPGSDTFEIISERAAIVRKIYDWALAGNGPSAIADLLNGSNIAVWERTDRWKRAHVRRLLKHSAVIGTMVPHRYEPINGKLRRCPEPPLRNYYPRIVSDEDYLEVHRLASLRYRGGSPIRFNLLSQLGKCNECGALLTWLPRGASGTPVLNCLRAIEGLCAAYREVDYDRLIKRILAGLPEALSEQRNIATLPALNRQLLEAFAVADQCRRAGDAVQSAMADEVLRETTDRVETTRRYRLTPHILRSLVLLDTISASTHAQSALSRSLRSIFASVHIRSETREAVFQWKGGGAFCL